MRILAAVWLVILGLTSVFAADPVTQAGRLKEPLKQPSTAIALCVAPAQEQQPPSFPAPKNVGDPAVLGRGIQRTMTLLATSTPEQRNTVKNPLLRPVDHRAELVEGRGRRPAAAFSARQPDHREPGAGRVFLAAAGEDRRDRSVSRSTRT